jgi:hypothetical protein
MLMGIAFPSPISSPMRHPKRPLAPVFAFAMKKAANHCQSYFGEQHTWQKIRGFTRQSREDTGTPSALCSHSLLSKSSQLNVWSEFCEVVTSKDFCAHRLFSNWTATQFKADLVGCRLSPRLLHHVITTSNFFALQLPRVCTHVYNQRVDSSEFC